MAGDVKGSLGDQAVTRAKLHTTEQYVSTGELSIEHEVPLYKDITLTAAQLDALNATPVSLIAAPGVGKILVLDRVVGYMKFVTTAYAGSSEVLEIRYTNASGSKVCNFSEATFVEAAADAWEVPAILVANPATNAAIVAAANADWTTGDGIVYLRIYYRILTQTLNNTP